MLADGLQHWGRPLLANPATGEFGKLEKFKLRMIVCEGDQVIAETEVLDHPDSKELKSPFSGFGEYLKGVETLLRQRTVVSYLVEGS